jgi:hypothetical protein
MRRKSVDSTNLASVGYKKRDKTLEVRFKSNGSVYQYENVPEEVFDGLMKAESKGQYLHNHIRGAYPYKKVDK